MFLLVLILNVSHSRGQEYPYFTDLNLQQEFEKRKITIIKETKTISYSDINYSTISETLGYGILIKSYKSPVITKGIYTYKLYQGLVPVEDEVSFFITIGLDEVADDLIESAKKSFDLLIEDYNAHYALYERKLNEHELAISNREKYSELAKGISRQRSFFPILVGSLGVLSVAYSFTIGITATEIANHLLLGGMTSIVAAAFWEFLIHAVDPVNKIGTPPRVPKKPVKIHPPEFIIKPKYSIDQITGFAEAYNRKIFSEIKRGSFNKD